MTPSRKVTYDVEGVFPVGSGKWVIMSTGHKTAEIAEKTLAGGRYVKVTLTREIVVPGKPNSTSTASSSSR